MSQWNDRKKEDISLSQDGDEIHIYTGQDSSGAIYTSVKTQDIRDLLSDPSTSVKGGDGV